jgi:hypothetical protein
MASPPHQVEDTSSVAGWEIVVESVPRVTVRVQVPPDSTTSTRPATSTTSVAGSYPE